jgi:hypothetical protein
MLLARLATKKAKPNGQFVLGLEDYLSAKSSMNSPCPSLSVSSLSTLATNPSSSATMVTQKIEEFLQSLPLSALPGVGYKLERKLKEQKLTCCKDVLNMRKESLQQMFGVATGEMLFNSSRGCDHTPLETMPERKSIGVEVNWGIRFTDVEKAVRFFGFVCAELSNRMAQGGIKGGRTLTVKVQTRKEGEPQMSYKFLGTGKCDVASKSITLQQGVSSSKAIEAHALPLFRTLSGVAIIEDLRGVGLHLTKLVVDDKQLMKGIGNARGMDSFVTVAAGSTEAKSPKTKGSTPGLSLGPGAGRYKGGGSSMCGVIGGSIQPIGSLSAMEEQLLNRENVSSTKSNLLSIHEMMTRGPEQDNSKTLASKTGRIEFSINPYSCHNSTIDVYVRTLV